MTGQWADFANRHERRVFTYNFLTYLHNFQIYFASLFEKVSVQYALNV